MFYSQSELKEKIRTHNDGEITINDSLYFGINLYADAQDVIMADINKEDTAASSNKLFTHLNVDGADIFIDFLYNRDGYLYSNEDAD